MINYGKRGLRLGYLIRGVYHDEGGVERALRLCGPSQRTGTGVTAPDPDGAGTWPARRSWRAGAFSVTLTDDVGKLTQTLQTPSALSLEIPVGYPATPSRETAAPTDSDLREAGVSGRWWSKAVDLWLIDLDTGDTDHRFAGQWSRDPAVQPGAMRLEARARPGPLQKPWRVGALPLTANEWTETNLLDPSGLVNLTPDAYGLAESVRGANVGCVFGHNDAVFNLTMAPVTRKLVWYGRSTGTDRAEWFFISPQYGCGVGSVRFIGDDGTLYASGSGGVATSPVIGHNYYPDRGPLGTFCKIGVTSAIQSNFNPATNGNEIWGRIHGPGANPADVEWNTLTATGLAPGEPFTTLSGGGPMLPAIEHAADILEHIIEDTAFLGDPALLGTGAVGAFKAGVPSTVAEYPEMLCAVPLRVEDTEPPTYREVISALMASLPADLVWRRDSATASRRLFPWWRRPQSATERPDFDLTPADYVSSQPPSVSQALDPRNEYANDLTVLAPEFINQPQSMPSTAEPLSQMARNSQRIRNPTEQGPTRLGAPIAATRKWAFWSPHSSTTGAEHSRIHAGEASQRQIWTVASLGGIGYEMQVGDTLRHSVHGVTDSVGMIRRLEYDLAEQTVEVTAVHLVFYDTTEVGGGLGDGD